MKKCRSFISILLIVVMLVNMSVPTFAAVNATLDKKSVTIYEGQTTKLTVIGKETKQKVKWYSRNKKIAVVTQSGKVTGKKAGTCVIVAKVSRKTLTCKVTVNKVVLNATKVNLLYGKSTKLYLRGGKIKAVKSSNAKIAVIQKNGCVTAKKLGNTKVTITGTNNKKYTCNVTVSAGLNKKQIGLTDGCSTKVELAGAKIVSVTSSNPETAKAVRINQKYLKITGVEPGDVTIRVGANNGKYYICNVRVESPLLNKKQLLLAKDDIAKLKLSQCTQTIIWSSNRNGVAKVDKKGVVTAKANGTAIITAKDEYGKTYQCQVVVEEPKLYPETMNLSAGNQGMMVLAQNTQDVVWSVSNQSVVSIDENGIVTAHKNGTAVVTAKVKSGHIFTCNVTVGGKNSKNECTITFVDLEGGSSLKNLNVAKHTKVSQLPKPEYKDMKHSFLGWYYDEELGRKAYDEDEITKSMALYAGVAEMDVKTPEEVVTITSKDDAKPDIAIRIKSADTELTAEQVYNLIDVKNVTHSQNPDYELKENNIEVTGENGHYTVTGKHFLVDTLEKDFEEGASYIIKLPELDSEGKVNLTFDGCPDSVREYDLTIHQEEVNNMHLASDVVSLSVDEVDALYDKDGNKLEYIDGSFFNVNSEGAQEAATLAEGYFICTNDRAAELEVDTTIALYSGMKPEKAIENPEQFNKGDNHVAYITITNIEGDKFQFGNAELEDVIGVPNVLPVPEGADLNLDNKQNTYELPENVLDWSDDVFAQQGLDAKTTLNVGDYLIFYSGEYGTDSMKSNKEYKEVLDIKEGYATTNITGDTVEYVIVTTKEATLEEMVKDSNSSFTMPVDMLDNLSQPQVDKLEKEIANQVEKSHFAEEASAYLTKATLATDKFSNLDGFAHLDDYDVVLKKQAQKLGGNAKVMDITRSYSNLGNKYKDMIESYEKKDSDGAGDGSVKVEIEEVEISLAKSKHLQSGVGIKIHVQFKIEIDVPKYEGKKDGKKDDGKKDDGKKDDGKKDDGKKDDGKKDDGKKDDDKKDEDIEPQNKLCITVSADFEQEITLKMGFGAKVEWKTVAGFIPYPADVIFTPSLTTGTYTGLDFNAVITTGVDDGDSVKKDRDEVIKDIGDELKKLMDEGDTEEGEDSQGIANWISEKYSDMLDEDHDPVNLVEKELSKQQLDAVPGIISFSLAEKLVVSVDLVVVLGVEFSYINCKKHMFSISLISKKCSSETVEVIPSEMDFKFYIMGTLEIRVGIVLEFRIELLEGLLASTGIDFGIGAYLELKGFFYYHLNIKKGHKTTNYAGALYVEIGIYLDISFCAQIGKATKQVPKGKIIGWNVPIYSKKFPLKSFGEQKVPIDFSIEQDQIVDIDMHQYIKSFVIPDEYYKVYTLDMDDGSTDRKIYDNKCYGVKLSDNRFEYDQENHIIRANPQNGEKELKCEATLYWKKNPTPLSTAFMERKINITWDNYKDGYAITPISEGGSFVPATIKKAYAAVKKPADPVKTGYIFAGWRTEDGKDYEYPEVMPDKDTTIYAKWEPAADTRYTVEHYKEKPGKEYEYDLVEKERLKGVTDSIVTPDTKDYSEEGYEIPVKEKLEILPDGSAVLRYYYNWKRSKTTFTTGEHGTAADVVFTTKYGEKILVPDIAAEGYIMTGWKNQKTGDFVSLEELVKNNGSIGEADGTDAVYVAQWKVRDDIKYRIEYYVQQPSGAYTVQATKYSFGSTGQILELDDLRKEKVTYKTMTESGVEGEITGEADALFLQNDPEGNPVVEFDGIYVNGEKTSETAIRDDGKTVVKVKYRRKVYNITLKKGEKDDSCQNEGAYTVYPLFCGAKMALPELEKTGYTFDGWQDETGNTITDKTGYGYGVITVQKDAEYTSGGWTANPYTVRYDLKGGILSGNTDMTQHFTYDKEQALYDAPVREGYEFTGWLDKVSGKTYQAGEIVSNLTDEAAGVIDLTATYSSTRYPVEYDLNGGTLSEEEQNPDSYALSDDAFILREPVKSGYTFEGWFQGEEQVTILPRKTTGGLKLTAKWKANKSVPYVVRHYAEDVDGIGKTLMKEEKFEGTTGMEVTPAVETYEGFTSPSEVTATILGDGSLAIDYIYHRKEHTLTLDLDGGSSKEELTRKMKYGENITLTNPEKEGYVFGGWLLDEQLYGNRIMPDTDLSLKANWLKNQCALVVNHYKMDLNGEYTILAKSETITSDKAEKIEVKPDVYEGFTSPAARNAKLQLGKTVTVDLKYARKKYNLTWQLGDAVSSNVYTSGMIYYGAPVIKPTAVRTGYAYTWNEEPEETMPAKDLAYTAVWTPKQYEVTFHTMDGNDKAQEKTTVTFGETYGTLSTPVKAHYRFLGWFDKREGGNQITANSPVAIGADHTLYAHWELDGQDITYCGLVDTDINENPTTYEVGTETIIIPPVREGYTFKGWVRDGETTNHLVYTITEQEKQPVTLTAVWEINEYRLTLYSEGVIKEQKLQFGESLSSVLVPMNPGYKIAGWRNAQTNKLEAILPETMPANDLTYFIQWETQTYHVVIMNPYDCKVDSIKYTMDDSNFQIPAPEVNRTGYDFDGWFTDEICSEDARINHFIPVPFDKQIFAKWVPRKYTVSFYGQGGKDVDAKECISDTYVYDQTKTLPSPFTREGYTFEGWAVTSNGAVKYKPGTVIPSLGYENLSKGNEIINLFAVWEAIPYEITYMNTETGGSQNGWKNPSSYTTESNDAMLERPKNIQAGYEFLGWYEDTNKNGKADANDTKITNLKLKGETGDKKLYARWAHAGIFSIQLKESSSSHPTGEGTSTYTITREIPDGAEVSKAAQRVYFRTDNGTLIGGTVNAVNFLHVGGENVFAEFEPDKVTLNNVTVSITGEGDERKVNKELSKKTFEADKMTGEAVAEFVVSQENAEARYAKDKMSTPTNPIGLVAQGLVRKGTDRYYYTSLYRINRASGDVTGVIKNGCDCVKRTMTYTNETSVTKNDLYGQKTKEYGLNHAMGNEEQHKTHYGYFSLSKLFPSSLMLEYLQTNGSTGNLKVDVYNKVRDDDGASAIKPWIEVYYHLGGTKIIETERKGNSSGWESGSCQLSSKQLGQLANNSITLTTRVSTGTFTCWRSCPERNIFTLNITDNIAPQQDGIAPGAFCKYKAGDTVYFSVVYNEIIDSYNDVSIDSSMISKYMPLEDIQCVDGEGTNVLLFKGTAEYDFENKLEGSSGTNEELMKINPVRGTVCDMLGNK